MRLLGVLDEISHVKHLAQCLLHTKYSKMVVIIVRDERC